MDLKSFHFADKSIRRLKYALISVLEKGMQCQSNRFFDFFRTGSFQPY